jgi:hypothetical protein
VAENTVEDKVVKQQMKKRAEKELQGRDAARARHNEVLAMFAMEPHNDWFETRFPETFGNGDAAADGANGQNGGRGRRSSAADEAGPAEVACDAGNSNDDDEGEGDDDVRVIAIMDDSDEDVDDGCSGGGGQRQQKSAKQSKPRSKAANTMCATFNSREWNESDSDARCLFSAPWILPYNPKLLPYIIKKYKNARCLSIATELRVACGGICYRKWSLLCGVWSLLCSLDTFAAVDNSIASWVTSTLLPVNCLFYFMTIHH